MTKIHEYAVRSFSERLNSIDQHIQFTSEEEKNGTIPFLDTCLHVNQDGSAKVTVYRKPTHTDQYLNFHSNHHLQHKRAVVNTLLLRAKTLVSGEDDRVHEIQHVKQALKTLKALNPTRESPKNPATRREYTPQYHTSKAFRNAYKEHLNHTRSQSSTSLSILFRHQSYSLVSHVRYVRVA